MKRWGRKALLLALVLGVFMCSVGAAARPAVGEEKPMYGDVDSNQKITPTDALLVLQHTVGLVQLG